MISTRGAEVVGTAKFSQEKTFSPLGTDHTRSGRNEKTSKGSQVQFIPMSRQRLPNTGSEVLRIALEQCCRIVFVFFFPVVGYFIGFDGYRPATSISRADIIEAHL